jgi:hypothetical protein
LKPWATRKDSMLDQLEDLIASTGSQGATTTELQGCISANPAKVRDGINRLYEQRKIWRARSLKEDNYRYFHHTQCATASWQWWHGNAG